MPARANDLAQVARDYDVPIDVVEAAFASYQRHRPEIDARIAANALDRACAAGERLQRSDST
jgi:hypothetical protein